MSAAATVVPSATAVIGAIIAAIQAWIDRSRTRRMVDEAEEVLRVAEQRSQVILSETLGPEETKRRYASMQVIANTHRRESKRSSVRRLLISVAASAMPRSSRCEWYAAIAEAAHDFPMDEHDTIMRDFLFSAPRWIVASWYSLLRQPFAAGAPERPSDEW